MDFFLGGCAACCAGVFSNPMDVIKTRQQLQGELMKRSAVGTNSPYSTLMDSIKSVIRSEGGLWGLQKGLAPALMFQFVMNSVRLGSFETVDKLGWTRDSSGQHSPGLCVLWGGFSGVIGASLGCPFFMVKTQMQSSAVGKYAVGYQHNHRNTWAAFRSAYNKNGMRGLWRGFTGMVPRTGIGSSVQLSTFTQSKDFCLKYQVQEIPICYPGNTIIITIFIILFDRYSGNPSS